MTRLFIFLITVVPLFSFAKKQGQARLDSMVQMLPGLREDTGKVKILNVISGEYWAYDPDKGIKYAEQALQLAKQLNYPVGMANAYTDLGVNYRYKSDYTRSQEYYTLSLVLCEQTGNKAGLAAVYNNMCVLQISQSDYPKALEYAFKALRINEDIGRKGSICRNLANIGLIYDDQGEYDKALEYYTRSLKIAEELNDRISMAITFTNLGLVYREKKDLSKALEMLLRAQQMCRELGDKSVLSSTLCYISTIYREMHNYQESLRYLAESMKIETELGNKAGLAEKLLNTGITYLSMAENTQTGRNRNTQEAINDLSQAAMLHKEVGDLKDLAEDYRNLSTAYELAGNTKDALYAHKMYMANKDSVFSQQNKESIARIAAKRELDLKDKQIEINKLEIAKKRNENVFFIAGILLLSLVCIFIYRNYALQRRSNALLSVEKKRSEDLLLNILPAGVAAELKEKGVAEARSHENVTVMFADFVNFTGMAGKIDPKELIDELHTCFTAFDNIIGKFKLEKVKTIGDAYMAVAGLPSPDEHHAELMVSAALEISSYIEKRKAALGDRGFSIRVGINSGRVIAGIIGIKKFAYDIWGDTVNIAARMEQTSMPGKINITNATYELVKDKFDCTYRGKIDIKNRGEMEMYFVDGVKV